MSALSLIRPVHIMYRYPNDKSFALVKVNKKDPFIIDP